MPEARFRQHHAGEEGAHRHRQPAQLHHQRGAEHHQQRGRRHHLARLRIGEHAEHRVEQPLSRCHQRRDGRERDADGEPARARAGLRRRRRQERDQREQRHDRQVFEQQRRHQPLTLRGCDVAALLEDLHHDGGRREHEAHGGEERHHRGKSEQDADAGDQRAAGGDLRHAEPEDLPSQAPQPRRLHLESDDEQEHHHAEFGDMQDRLRVGEQPQPERADHEPGRQVAQHRPETRPLEQRNGDDRRAQQRDDMHQIGSLLRCRHLRPARSSTRFRPGCVGLSKDPVHSQYGHQCGGFDVPIVRAAITGKERQIQNHTGLISLPVSLQFRRSYTDAARLTNVGIGDTGPVRIDSKGAHVKQSAHFEGQAFRIGGFEPATGRFR